MPDASWKAFERRVAAIVGGRRVGPQGGSGPDVVSSWCIVECKYRTRPSWTDVEEAQAQIMACGEKDKLKLSAHRKKGELHFYFVIRDDEFERWVGEQKSG